MAKPIERPVDNHLYDCKDAQFEEDYDELALECKVILDAHAVLEERVILHCISLNFFLSFFPAACIHGSFFI